MKLSNKAGKIVMKPSFTDKHNAQDAKTRFDQIPGRIFLDTCALQYIQDFGEYIFDNYQEDEEYFLAPRGKRIEKDNPLYPQIVALHDLFLGSERAHFEFALSESVYQEVVQKKQGGEIDKGFLQWFYDVWDHWQAVLESYEDEPVSQEAQKRYELAKSDKSLLGNLSEPDQKIVLDAIQLDCDALLTVDKFAKDNFQHFAFEKYGLMVLRPTDLIEIIKPFQGLYH